MAKPVVDFVKSAVDSRSVWPPAVEYVRFDQKATVTARAEERLIAGVTTYCLKDEFAETAPPTFPVDQLTPFARVATRALPEASVALVPSPSSNVQWPALDWARAGLAASTPQMLNTSKNNRLVDDE